VTNESQFGVSEMTSEDRANFDKFAVLCIKGIFGVDHEDRLATDLTIDTSDRSLVVSSQIFWYEEAMIAVDDQVGVDTLANQDRQIQEVREGWWDRDGNEVLLDREVFPWKWSRRSRPGLGKCREKIDWSSLSGVGDGSTRFTGSELAEGLLVGKSMVGKWNRWSSRSGSDESTEVLGEGMLCRGRRWQVGSFHSSSEGWLW
jgi:hypothetical protein